MWPRERTQPTTSHQQTTSNDSTHRERPRRANGEKTLCSSPLATPTPPNTSRPSVPPRRTEATRCHRRAPPRSICTLLRSLVRHTRTHIQSASAQQPISASCVRTSASYLDVFSGRSRGIQRTAANQATAARGPACSCSVEVLVDHTTQQPCTTTHGRDSNFEPRLSSTASNHCTCTDKPSCKRRRLVKQLSACVQRSAML